MTSRNLLVALALSTLSCRGGGGVPETPPAPTKPSTNHPAANGITARVDEALRATWKKEGLTPAPLVDDAGFLRRVTLDITGTVPKPDEIALFLSDTSPDKRARAVDALLASPSYAERWTDYWDGLLIGPIVREAVVDRTEFRKWLRVQFTRNAPWSDVVTGLVTASGINRPGNDDDDGVNGAVNWLLRYGRTPQDLSGNVSRVFLGVQIQCAQCHDHKTEKWTQGDFQSFTAIFVRTRPTNLGDDMSKGKRRIAVRDVARPALGGVKNPDLRAIAGATPKALDGTDLSGASPREALATWMTSPSNPWFSRAIVNRMWAHLTGRGFVEPIDDLRPSNPAVLPEVLDALADDFTASGYDLKHLVRAICATQAYQLAPSPAAVDTSGHHPLWSRRPIVPLAPDVLLRTLIDATHLEPVLARVAGGDVERLRTQLRRQFAFLFDVDEETPSSVFDGTVSQALMLLNGLLVNGGASDIPGAALAEVLAMPTDDAHKIEALYLRTLSRKPTPAELGQWTRFLDEPRDLARAQRERSGGDLDRRRGRGGKKKQGVAEPLGRFASGVPSAASTPKEQAYEDLFWALLNSTEFVFNH